jgi:hypothetical protein
MGYDTQKDITAHGFRAMARTNIAWKIKHWPLYYWTSTSVLSTRYIGAAYNHTKFIEQRTAMMQAWVDYLDELKAGAKVIPFKQA